MTARSDTYRACGHCGGRYYTGQNREPLERCGVCAPRDNGIDWARVPNLHRPHELEEPIVEESGV